MLMQTILEDDGWAVRPKTSLTLNELMVKLIYLLCIDKLIFSKMSTTFTVSFRFKFSVREIQQNSNFSKVLFINVEKFEMICIYGKSGKNHANPNYRISLVIQIDVNLHLKLFYNLLGNLILFGILNNKRLY